MPAISRMGSRFVLPLLLATVLSALFVTTTPKAEALTTSQRVGTAANIALRQVGDPYRWANPIKKRNLRRGDLMFFFDGGGVYHAAIFLRWRDGRAWMLDAPYSGQKVHRHFAWTTQWFGRTLR